MAKREENLKKINEELEKLSDEELEQVAGGDNLNTWHDFNFLSDLGVVHGSQWDDTRLVPEGWAKVGITYVIGKGGYKDAVNKYFLNGKEISRGEAFGIARKWADNYNPVLDAVENVLHNNPAFKL